jgi:ubiquinone/menaquinone biosynthesis C-methylase UbiE
VETRHLPTEDGSKPPLVLDNAQAASAAQFDRQSDRYGKSHILADTEDVATGMQGIIVPANGKALDVATGGGHTALWLARHGWDVTAGDISARMLENAKQLAANAGFSIDTKLFPAEQLPFGEASFDLVATRVAPHHFSSPGEFVSESARVLKRGGHLLVIDGTVPDNDAETEAWLHQVEKWRDPSHGRFLSRNTWEHLARSAGLQVLRSELHLKKQPVLEWYFVTAATSPANRKNVLHAVQSASDHVRRALSIADEDGKVVWWWPMLTLVAVKP